MLTLSTFYPGKPLPILTASRRRVRSKRKTNITGRREIILPQLAELVAKIISQCKRASKRRSDGARSRSQHIVVTNSTFVRDIESFARSHESQIGKHAHFYSTFKASRHVKTFPRLIEADGFKVTETKRSGKRFHIFTYSPASLFARSLARWNERSLLSLARSLAIRNT